MIEQFLYLTTKVFKHPVIIVILAIILTLFFAAAIPSIQFDNNVKSMLPANNKDVKINDYYESKNIFGSSALIFIGIETDNIYTEKCLNYVKKVNQEILDLNGTLPQQNISKLLQLTNEESIILINSLNELGLNADNYYSEIKTLFSSPEKMIKRFSWSKEYADKIANGFAKTNAKEIYEFYQAPIDNTQSIINADYIKYEDDSLVVKKLIDGEEINAETIKGLQERVNSWELYKNALVSEDKTMTTIMVKLNNQNINMKKSLNLAMENLFQNNRQQGFKIYIDGEPVIEELISRYMMKDIMFLMPMVLLVVILILFFCFRNISGVIYPLSVIFLSVVWPIGLMAYLHQKITVVGSAMPILLVAISSAYVIHFLNHYFLDNELDKLTAIKNNMKNVGIAILLSGITVMVGFGALVTADFVPIKKFGIFTALGDFFAIIASLYVLPALLLFSKKPKKIMHDENKKDLIAKILSFFVYLNKKHSFKIIMGSVLITFVFAIGTVFIKSELNNVALFRKTEPIHIADDKLNEKLAGTQVLNIVIDSDLSEISQRNSVNNPELIDIATPEVMLAVEEFNQSVMKRFPSIRKILCFNDILKKMNQEMNGGDPAFYKIPESKEIISQYLLIFSGDISNVITPAYDKMRITLSMKRTSTREIETIRQYCQNFFNKEFLTKNHIKVQVTGISRLYYVANKLLVEGMIESIIICVIIVFILLLIVLRSFFMSLIAMIPIGLTMAVNFGVLGFFNIPLNAGTAMVSSIAIGIGVDYSIHYITWYRNEMRKNKNIIQSLELTIIHKGRAILYNMLVIFGGFSVLLFSRFIPLMQFGGLVALCMLTTATGALVIVPAVMHVLANKKIKFLYLKTDQPN